MTGPPLDVEQILETFGGEVRLFPLPNLVLFPDSIAPFKMFERRYVKMTSDALADDHLIATALLKPGWDVGKLYEGAPPVYPVVTVTRILRHRRSQSGQYDILLYGLFRARILAEVPHDPYRRARVSILEDIVLPEEASEAARKMRRVLDLVPGRLSTVWEMRRMANQLRGVDGGAGRYADAVATASDLAPRDRYEILAESNVLTRLERLIELLEERAYEDAPAVPPRADPRWN